MAAQGQVVAAAFGPPGATAGRLLNYTLGREQALEQIGRLRGVQFQRLISYSNGATVSQNLIQRGVIKVDEWHILAGDQSVAKAGELRTLVETGKVQRVVVWVNRGGARCRRPRRPGCLGGTRASSTASWATTTG